MTLLGISVWLMGRHHMEYDVYGGKPPLGSEPHNFKCVAGEEAVDDNQAEFDQIQNKQEDKGKELVEKNLVEVWEKPQPIFVSGNLPFGLKHALLVLLQTFKDVFAWTYP